MSWITARVTMRLWSSPAPGAPARNRGNPRTSRHGPSTLMRGRADKVSTRDGSPFVQWGLTSLVLFAANIVAKLVLDLIGVAASRRQRLRRREVTRLHPRAHPARRSNRPLDAIRRRHRATEPATATTAQPRQPSTDRFIDVTPTAQPSIRYQVGDQRTHQPGHLGRWRPTTGPCGGRQACTTASTG